MYNKAERIILEDLSRELFSNPSMWRRFTKQRILADVQTVEQERMVTVNRGGTKMSFRKALARGLARATDKDGNVIPFTTSVQKPSYRSPTFEEVRDAMLSSLEMKKFSEIPPVHVLLLSAVKFVKGELVNMPYLVVGENQKRDYDSMVELIPEEFQEKMKSQVVPRGNPQVFCLDGFQFASDVVFATNRLEEAEALLEKYETGEVPELEVEVEENQAAEG